MAFPNAAHAGCRYHETLLAQNAGNTRLSPPGILNRKGDDGLLDVVRDAVFQIGFLAIGARERSMTAAIVHPTKAVKTIS